MKICALDKQMRKVTAFFGTGGSHFINLSSIVRCGLMKGVQPYGKWVDEECAAAWEMD